MFMTGSQEVVGSNPIFSTFGMLDIATVGEFAAIRQGVKYLGKYRTWLARLPE